MRTKDAYNTTKKQILQYAHIAINFKNNVISQEEKAGIEQEITEYFSLTNLQHASGNEIVSICKKMYFFEGEDLQTYLLLIKEWIIEHCKKEKEGVDEEKELLSVMEYYVCVVNKEKPNQIVNSYLELWEEILNQGIHIENDAIEGKSAS